MIFSKPVFQLWPEVPDKTLDWPSSAVSQSADGVALNLFAQFPNHINLLWLCVALSEPPPAAKSWRGGVINAALNIKRGSKSELCFGSHAAEQP